MRRADHYREAEKLLAIADRPGVPPGIGLLRAVTHALLASADKPTEDTAQILDEEAAELRERLT